MTNFLESVYRDFNGLKYLSISNETISETILRIIRRLINALGTVITDLGDNGFLALRLSSLNTEIEELLTTTRTTTLTGDSSSFVVNTKLPGLVYRDRPVNTVQTLVNQLKVLTDVTTKYGVYQQELTDNPELNNFTRMSNSNLSESIKKHAPSIKLVDSSFTQTAGKKDWLSKDLLGGKRLRVTGVVEGGYITDTNINFVNSMEVPKALPTHVDFERFPTTYQVSLLNAAQGLLGKLNLHYGTSSRYKRIKALKTLQSHLKRIELQASKTSDGTEIELRENMVLLGTYIKWLTGSYLEMIQLNVRVINSALNVCRQNLNPMKEH